VGLFADVGASFLLWAIVNKSRGKPPDVAGRAGVHSRAPRDHRQRRAQALGAHGGGDRRGAPASRGRALPQSTALWNLFIVAPRSRASSRRKTTDGRCAVAAARGARGVRESVELSEEQRAQLVAKLHDEYAGRSTPCSSERPRHRALRGSVARALPTPR
jgi:hypothetical protein